jgi:ElaB/YqjD/DUF883 family membrane-anchored ribosome-binding protein
VSRGGSLLKLQKEIYDKQIIFRVQPKIQKTRQWLLSKTQKHEQPRPPMKIGRATRKTIHDAQGATEEVWTEAAPRAKNLRSQVGVYLRKQPVNIIIIAVAAGFLLSLLLLFFRRYRK